MRHVQVDGLRVSVIGLGTAQFGPGGWGYGDDYAREMAPALVRRAVELGVTLIDTAEVYAFGRSEQIVGDVVGQLGAEQRSELTVATKFIPVMPTGPMVQRQAEGSVRRLGGHPLDLYYVHWANPFVSPRRTMAALRPLVESGTVVRVGVSNHSLSRWRAAELALRLPVIANQVRFSLASPAPRWELVPYAGERGRLIVAYSPLGQGLLASEPDRGSADRRAAAGPVRRMNPLYRERGRRLARPLVAAVTEVAETHGATRAQVALAWLLSHPNVVAIPGARTIEQLEENVRAADLDLGADDLAWLTDEAERFEVRFRG